uniref:Uncharacterized protein n=1 Tax=Glossina austeni TaxID=7395 RepID=A0A1A9UJN8_GLOAU
MFDKDTMEEEVTNETTHTCTILRKAANSDVINVLTRLTLSSAMSTSYILHQLRILQSYETLFALRCNKDDALPIGYQQCSERRIYLDDALVKYAVILRTRLHQLTPPSTGTVSLPVHLSHAIVAFRDLLRGGSLHY